MRWLTALFTVSFALIVFLIWGVAQAIDAEDLKHTREILNQSVEQESAQLLNQVRDYAIWDDAYQQWLRQEKADNNWLTSNFGESLYANLGIDWVFVKDDRNELIYSSFEGRLHTLPDNYTTVSQSALSITDQSIQLLMIGDEPWMLVCHQVQPELTLPDTAGNNRYFIFAKRLAPSLLKHISLHTNISDIHFETQPSADKQSLPIYNADGNPFIYFTWSAERPGSKLLHDLLPYIFLLLLSLATATLLLIKRIVHQGRESLKRIETLAETQIALSQQQNSLMRLRQRFQEQTDQKSFLQELIEEGNALITSDVTSVWLLDPSNEFATCEASNSAMKGETLHANAIAFCLNKLKQKPVITLDIDETLIQFMPDQSRPVLAFMEDYRIKSVAMTAIYLGGELRGVLIFGSYNSKQWSDTERYACSALAGVTAQFAETFQRKVVEEDLYQQTYFDPITELPRLAYAQQHFANSFDKQHGYMAIFRVQGLHIVNELHGMAAGNELFRQLSQLLSEQVAQYRIPSLLVRLQANRIGLFIDGEQEEVEAHIAQLIDLVEQRSWMVQRQNYSLQLQAGLACYPDDGRDIETLQHRAKLALQHVRNNPEIAQAFYSHDVHNGLKQHSDAVRKLRTALEREEFELYFQPQFSGQHRIVGAEALIRWQHPEKGLLTPYHFIDLAEETGLILPLGDWILERACQVLEIVPTTVSVNLSVLQLKQDDFVDKLKKLLAQYHFNPSQLVLEIVESLMVEQEIKEKLAEIRALGVEISLDDFGTGYSSLSYLQELQLDELKVDQSFIRALEDQDDAPLVRTIIAMAHTLNMRVVVEGIETEEQLDFVQGQGAELVQGYLLAKPMPQDHFMIQMTTPMLSL